MHTTTTTNSFTASPFTTSYFFNDQQQQQFPSANNAINRNTINRNHHNTMTNSSSLASSLSNDFTFANIYQPSSPFIQSSYHHFSTYPPSASYGYNNNNVNKVYTTEKYPSSFLPPETGSSASSSILSTSPSSISSSSSNSAETQFSPSIKSGNGNNCIGILKTKGSRASLRSNRSSLYLDPIMEEGANNFF
ncbi:4276_t:CDS:2 [Entrophospora sp. SA101]|nr:4276_t:CDS:2 [Entrophospora sp. SA101]